jgi:hypothetical protein
MCSPAENVLNQKLMIIAPCERGREKRIDIFRSTQLRWGVEKLGELEKCH